MKQKRRKNEHPHFPCGFVAEQAAIEIAPTTQHFPDHDDILTPADKNRLWKLVMKKATVYGSPDGKLTANICPALPR